jgi:hypothetical protein
MTVPIIYKLPHANGKFIPAVGIPNLQNWAFNDSPTPPILGLPLFDLH